jgi:hypothetical protein
MVLVDDKRRYVVRTNLADWSIILVYGGENPMSNFRRSGNNVVRLSMLVLSRTPHGVIKSDIY